MNYQPPIPFVAEQEGDVARDPRIDLHRNLRLAVIALALLVFGLFGMAALVRVTGAVIASGEVSVESRVKSIAHPTGGVIAEVYVREGDRVQRGAPLMRLDTTVAGVTASTSGEGLEQLLAARARLTAERDGLGGIAYPPALTQSNSPTARAAIAEENRLFALRRQARAVQQAQFAERISQSEQQIAAYQAQLAATRKQTALIAPERDSVRELWKKDLVTISRLNQLERTAAELEGSAASLSSQIAQTRARIAELRQGSAQLQQDARSQAGVELAEVVARLNEQQVRKVAAGDTVDRSVVRAPSAGVIDKLVYTTIGGVVPPAQTIMQIVPDTDELVVEAKVSPGDIDQLHIGQQADLRFTAFNQQTTPELKGTLRHVAAERTLDERTGQSFYRVRIAVDEAELKRLGALKLVPGMPVEAYIQTGDRSLLSYITKPLRDQLNRAFREN